MNNLWLLPAGIDDLLPADAARLEGLRRALIDHFTACGYDLVFPPLVEHLDSLLSIGGDDLALETFKLTDYLSGRQLGVRADMTPQIARIDAHVMGDGAPARLCYAAPVLRARTRQSFESREQFQLGAELYGSGHARADAEIIGLMLRSVSLCGFDDAHLDIGHVGIFRSIAAEAGLHGEVEAALFDALQRKSVPDLADLVRSLDLPAPLAAALVALPDLRGPVNELEPALSRIEGVAEGVRAAGHNLREVVHALDRRGEGAHLFFDLSELRGYHYHTGVVFSAFVDGHGREIARGGRYDAVGAAYGRSRAATGFSLDLRQVIRLARNGDQQPAGCILAPPRDDNGALTDAVQALRASGERVLRALDTGDEVPASCDRMLVGDGDTWQVVALDAAAARTTRDGKQHG